ncbi:hypothetical protein [Roseomonas sp. BN140053]|uniref:hypothetical protein n=1 Tax=Roseomonas sp. BN140053 TaxID=3391898 RepID=UPI0039EA5C25
MDEARDKKLVGPVANVDRLLQEETFAALDRQFTGCYAIVIHAADVDKAVDDYVGGHSLGLDTGKGVLALFVRRGADAREAEALAPQAGAMVDFARRLFPEEHIELPGIVLVARMAAIGTPAYVPLGGLDGLEKVAHRARSVLASAGEAVARHGTGPEFADALTRALAAKEIPYSRAGGKKVVEHLVIALRKLWGAKDDIMALVKLGTKLAG